MSTPLPASPASRYKDFPPGWGHIKVPVTSRRAALAGLALYAPCRRSAVWAQRAARACILMFGPTVLPGRSVPWVPMSEPGWLELAEAWRREIGAFDGLAGYTRRQSSRAGLALLLLRRGSPIAFVKLKRGEPAKLSNESLALDAVWRFQPRAFRIPEPLLSGSAGAWHYVMSAPLPGGLHHPSSHPPLGAILEEIDAALAGLPRPLDTPAHWRPMHGDFTPWNLRSVRGGSLVLFDWEDAGWAPPGADEVRYRATWAAITHRPADRCGAHEAVQFWRERGLGGPENARDERLGRALRGILERMAIL
jgi:Phosphotransferase enzyme family